MCWESELGSVETLLSIQFPDTTRLGLPYMPIYIDPPNHPNLIGIYDRHGVSGIGYGYTLLGDIHGVKRKPVTHQVISLAYPPGLSESLCKSIRTAKDS